MSEARFNLIFKGKVGPGKDLDEVRRTLENLFKVDSGNQCNFFDGQAIVLGRNMDAMTANAFKQALAAEDIITHIFTATDSVAEEDAQSRRLAQRRKNFERRTRVRNSAILPDRRLVLERRA